MQTAFDWKRVRFQGRRWEQLQPRSKAPGGSRQAFGAPEAWLQTPPLQAQAPRWGWGEVPSGCSSAGETT